MIAGDVHNGGSTAPPSLGVPASFARSCAAERRAEGSRRESPGCHLPELPTYFLSRVQSYGLVGSRPVGGAPQRVAVVVDSFWTKFNGAKSKVLIATDVSGSRPSVDVVLFQLAG